MKRLKILYLIGLFLMISCNKGTKENPIDRSSRNWGKLTHLKYNLYESDFQNKKTIVEKIVYYDPEDKKHHSFYTDQLSVEEPGKSVMLTYSSVIDISTYKELEGTCYAVDKNRVYFLDTTVRTRTPLYDPDPKLFIKHFGYDEAKNKYYLPENKRFKNYKLISKTSETIVVNYIQWATTDRPNFILAKDYQKHKNQDDLVDYCFFLDTQNITIWDFPKDVNEQLDNGKPATFTGRFYKTKQFDDAFPYKGWGTYSFKSKDGFYKVFVYEKIKNK
ncbi:hypothetical protein N6B72_13730 [Chryseobacterium soli]|uniref:hypothetical protein n=1 Tax=Chryseobacterium soli TaxID=445961 RepID=UPI0029546155|nr:hypothetical protein [Chryseobacterium soli]MDV7697981.1 hypothetical protein [Chryseobacterium soli]